MTMFRFGPLLALAGAACLVAWTPEGRPPPPEVATLDRASGSRFDAPPDETGSISKATQSAVAARPIIGDQRLPERVSLAAAEPTVAPVSLPEQAPSDALSKVQFAYADLEGAAPALGALSELLPEVRDVDVE